MAGTLTSIRLDAKLADKAVRVLGAKSRTEAVHIGLEEIVALQDFKSLMKKYGGKGEFAGSDEPRAVGAGGQRNQHDEVQVAEFVSFEALVAPHLGEDEAGFKPVAGGRREDWVPVLHCLHRLSIRLARNTAP